ncbi:TonB-dependent receptor [Compostibacter hankyongensis]|uniref:TonB-dependent receptor n=1 Tax=Compostibacter hankyongensis TaxID=1007089 RepID=A0ABP8FSS2_9BACT
MQKKQSFPHRHFGRRLPVLMLRAMRITLFLTFACILKLSARGYSQEVRLSFSLHEAKLSAVFRIIQDKSDYQFLYNDEDVQQSPPVTLSVKDATIPEVLDLCFRTSSLRYHIEQKTVVVSQQPSPPVTAALPAFTVKGKVTDPAGNALPGVSVSLKGTQTGTITDADGNYSLELPSGTGTLVFSYVGYNKQEMAVEGRSSLNVTLRGNVSSLEELMVVGYGTQKKKDLTGAVSRVDNTRFETLPNTNISQALRGSIPGVNISAGGNAGSGSSVSIRGQNSITGGNEALVVVDGIIYNGQLGDLNPNDIASIDVLRDASSAAIFGSRAANGVILVTTKRGTTAKPTIQFNSYAGVQDMLMTQHLESPGEYIQKKINYQKTLAFRGVAPEPDPSNPVQYLNEAEVDNYKKGIVVDPLDVITRTAPIQSYNLSVGANTGKTNYFIAGNWTDQKGVVIGDRFRRASLRVNLETEVTDWLKVGTNSSFSFVDVSGSRASLGSAINLSPYATWYLDSAKTTLNPVPMTDGLIGNPLMPTLDQNTNQRKDLFGIVYAELKIPFIKGLTYRFTYSNDLISGTQQHFSPSFNAGGLDRVATASTLDSSSQDMYLESLIKYNHTFAQDHKVDVTLLYNYNFSSVKLLSANANTFPSDVLSYYSLSLGENQNTAAGYADYHAIAMMARLNYSYKDRYLLTVTGRRDGASVFSDNNKFAFFPSVGLGWVVSEENFLKNNPVIDFLKLRLSWGANGNQAIARYQSLSRIEPGGSHNYLLGGTTAYGIAKTSIGNPDLKWESTYATNLGLDFELLHSKISGSLNYYNSDTRNLLLNRNIPILNGFSSVLSNLGAVNNKGIEVELTTPNVLNGAVKWGMGLNFARNKNRIVHLYGDKDENGKELDDISNNWFIGKSLGAYYNYEPDGIWQTGDDIPEGFRAGDVRLKDLNGDGKITPDGDRTILGYDKPDYMFGFNTSVQYKGFSLYVQVTGAVGGDRDNRDILDPPVNFTYRMHGIYQDWWTPDNPNNSLPSMDYQDAYHINFLQSTTWVRIQDVSLSYTFPKPLTDRLKMNQLQVYVSSKNSFLFTQWGGWDPETTGTGRGQYPTMRSLIFGLNLSL